MFRVTFQCKDGILIQEFIELPPFVKLFQQETETEQVIVPFTVAQMQSTDLVQRIEIADFLGAKSEAVELLVKEIKSLISEDITLSLQNICYFTGLSYTEDKLQRMKNLKIKAIPLDEYDKRNLKPIEVKKRKVDYYQSHVFSLICSCLTNYETSILVCALDLPYFHTRIGSLNTDRLKWWISLESFTGKEDLERFELAGLYPVRVADIIDEHLIQSNSYDYPVFLSTLFQEYGKFFAQVYVLYLKSKIEKEVLGEEAWHTMKHDEIMEVVMKHDGFRNFVESLDPRTRKYALDHCETIEMGFAYTYG